MFGMLSPKFRSRCMDSPRIGVEFGQLFYNLCPNIGVGRHNPVMTPDYVSRRRILQLAGSTATVGLAGCAGGDEENNGSGGATTTTPTTTPTDTTTEEPSVTPALSVSDIETDNRNVVLSSASIDGDGWVVLHPEAEGGGPNGQVTLAQKQLSAGEYSDVELAMNTLLAGEQTVYAMLHYDDPADGEFTFPENGDPPVTTDGNPVVKPFEITLTGEVTPSLSVTDQETSGERVTVPSTAIDQTGWLVIHPDAEGGGPNGGVTLATMQLQPGLYADVSLRLDESITESQTVYAMLHYDDPMDDEFTFPENGDPPVTKDGNPIVKPFDVTVGGGEASMQTVELVNTAFDPVRATVAPGTTVEWVNQDSFGHDVTSAQFHDVAEQWDFSTSLSSSGNTATYTFESEGIYEYECTIHGSETMCGVVLVGDVSLDQDLPCEGGGGGY